MHVQQLFLQLSGLKLEKNITVTGFNLQMAAKPKQAEAQSQLQVPTASNELTLSVYRFLICYKINWVTIVWVDFDLWLEWVAAVFKS